MWEYKTTRIVCVLIDDASTRAASEGQRSGCTYSTLQLQRLRVLYTQPANQACTCRSRQAAMHASRLLCHIAAAVLRATTTTVSPVEWQCRCWAAPRLVDGSSIPHTSIRAPCWHVPACQLLLHWLLDGALQLLLPLCSSLLLLAAAAHCWSSLGTHTTAE